MMGEVHALTRTVCTVCFIMILLVLTVAAIHVAYAEAQKTEEYYKTIYPCTNCHATMQLTGDKKASTFHNIDLTRGAHRGLYCLNCHKPPFMIELKNDVFVYIPGYHDRSLVMETNKLCATCHPGTYEDYRLLVHGNKTYTCPDGDLLVVKGYKDVAYSFHICPNGYKNLTTVPARACVECHDPHDPVYPSPSLLPPPSERPKPPSQDSIAIANVLAVIGALIPIGFALTRFATRAEK